MENHGLLWPLLFDQFSDGVCISEPSGPLLYMNPAARRMLGVANGENRQQLCDLLCAHLACGQNCDAASACPLRKTQVNEPSVTLEGEFVTPNVPRGIGLRVRCLKMPSVLTDAHGKEAHFTLIQDVSADMQLAREKKDWRQMLAHDLRAPMTTVFGTLRLLQELPKEASLGASERRQLDASIRGCQRMMELVDLYLDLSKLEAGAMPIRLETIDVARIARDSAKLARPFAEHKEIRLKLSAENGVEATADPELCRRVIDNILNNALKFTPQGGTVHLHVERNEEGMAVVSTRDSGPGIAREDLPHIFDRFYQASRRQPGVIRSTGLGLAFCKRAVESMKGRIEVISVPGKGSEFIVRLPGVQGNNGGK